MAYQPPESFTDPSSPWYMPAPGEYWPNQHRTRCCEEDTGGSHYHCGRCNKVTSMMGHYMRIRGNQPGDKELAERLGITLPFNGITCAPETNQWAGKTTEEVRDA